jgi:hypothetical protein
MRRSAPQAVSVPQEIAAPVSMDSVCDNHQ